MQCYAGSSRLSDAGWPQDALAISDRMMHSTRTVDMLNFVSTSHHRLLLEVWQ